MTGSRSGNFGKLIFLWVVCLIFSLSAQGDDFIVTKKGQRISGKILKMTRTHLKFKKNNKLYWIRKARLADFVTAEVAYMEPVFIKPPREQKRSRSLSSLRHKRDNSLQLGINSGVENSNLSGANNVTAGYSLFLSAMGYYSLNAGLSLDFGLEYGGFHWQTEDHRQVRSKRFSLPLGLSWHYKKKVDLYFSAGTRFSGVFGSTVSDSGGTPTGDETGYLTNNYLELGLGTGAIFPLNRDISFRTAFRYFRSLKNLGNAKTSLHPSSWSLSLGVNFDL